MLSKALLSPLFWWKTLCFSSSLLFSISLSSTFTISFLCKLFGSLLPFLLSLFALVGSSTLWLMILRYSSSRETNTEALLLLSTSWEAKEVNGEEKAILCLLSLPSLGYCGSSLAKLMLLDNFKKHLNSLRDAWSTESSSTCGFANKCWSLLTRRNHLGIIQLSCHRITTILGHWWMIREITFEYF